MKDCYLKELKTKVKKANGKFIVFDDTIFYPESGGQPHDTGKVVTKDGEEYNVVFVGIFSGEISHEVDKLGLKQEDEVILKIDWNRRYTLMKMHTAAHVLSRVIFEDVGAHTSGNQLGTDKSRIDFTLEEFDREKIPSWFEKANKIISEGAEVEKSVMQREDVLKLVGSDAPSLHLMKDFEELRVVNIKEIDAQPCGGTHVDDIREIGKIVFLKAENKGANNRRIYFGLE